MITLTFIILIPYSGVLVPLIFFFWKIECHLMEKIGMFKIFDKGFISIHSRTVKRQVGRIQILRKILFIFSNRQCVGFLSRATYLLNLRFGLQYRQEKNIDIKIESQSGAVNIQVPLNKNSLRNF